MSGILRRSSRLPIGCLACVAAGLIASPGRAVAGDVPAEVLAAEQSRIAAIDRASRAAVAIFAGQAGGGSGVLISPDGYALTNFHVVQPAGVAMKCGLADGRLYDAVLVGLDPTGDVALVKLSGREDFPHAELTDSDLVEVGDCCFAAGNPFLLATDFRPSISAGIVSGVHRYQFPAGTILEYADCLQVDAAINPGNSGGGLFDAQGRLIGVNGRASFEKRGRVNVGVGYAISANQLRYFLGFLKAGRLVDHATLGATVASDENGRVVVSDILETSDAYRRGLRYDDEIVALAGRPVRTVNALKNVLGTMPAGWRVPVVFRRSGRRMEILVRLAGLHRPAELARIVAAEDADPEDADPGNPKRGRHSPPQPTSKAAPASLPDAVKDLYEARPGFANHHFNVVERDRVAAVLATAATWAPSDKAWVISGRLGNGAPFRIVLSDTRGMIDLPTGTTAVDALGELDADPSPPGSGGLLAALLLWRKLLIAGPENLGRTTYWGTQPHAPGDLGEFASVPFDDVLETAAASVEARFAIGADGRVNGIDLWPAPDSDPCEVRIEGRADGPPGIPGLIEVRHGDVLFDTFRLDEIRFESVVAEPSGETS